MKGNELFTGTKAISTHFYLEYFEAMTATVAQ